MSINTKWKYAVRLYAGHRHATAPHGRLVLETRHSTKASKDVEVSAALSCDDIAFVEVADMDEFTVETLYE